MNARHLYERMKSETDFSSILRTAAEDAAIGDRATAESLLDAFLQWFSLIPLLKEGERLQMLRGVDPIWHAFILHTKAYRNFCNQYIGGYVDHDPTDVANEELAKREYAQHTIHLLDDWFGEDVHPKLRLLEEGTTCCTIIGCRKRTSATTSPLYNT